MLGDSRRKINLYVERRFANEDASFDRPTLRETDRPMPQDRTEGSDTAIALVLSIVFLLAGFAVFLLTGIPTAIVAFAVAVGALWVGVSFPQRAG